MAINAGFPLYDAYQAIKVPNAGIQSVEKNFAFILNSHLTDSS
jgi:hypothetical protein